ncbi:protein kinase domain-containing protein [Streptosporangium sandarakinum]|uniref:serine/threonine-protein kinase n=1 Tax=Streptosporangium sandarakinum TaxID=1260955 RepID=UPI003D8EFEFC
MARNSSAWITVTVRLAARPIRAAEDVGGVTGRARPGVTRTGFGGTRTDPGGARTGFGCARGRSGDTVRTDLGLARSGSGDTVRAAGVPRPGRRRAAPDSPVPGREPASPRGPRPGEPPYGTSRTPAHHTPGPYDRPSPAGTFTGAGGPAGSLRGREGREGQDSHDGHRDRGGRHDGHDRRDPQGGHDHEERRLGPYRLVGTLGRGGQGTVHLALTPRGEKVAIKVLHEHFTGDPVVRERFIREVEATRRVATFSTARVLDVNITDDQAYVVSEYVDGVSLEQLVREQGPRTEDGLTRLALSTAGALAAIHRAGVVHRDFKPANVLIGGDGPRVIDFGIARALDQATATATGSVIGTPAYMSPEQISGEHVGPESDVFSWASTMIFAASGRVAFGADTIPAILNRVISHHPDLSSLPSSLRPLAASCLDKRPANRPTAADIMLRIVH